jgi:peptidoglycan/xylan/chitin deacetylase (PgdA/CDA1 family)
MIGVIADPADHNVVREFFELFKTPWEFYRQDRQYDVLLCARDDQADATVKLVLFYGGRKMCFDDDQKIQTWRKWNHPCVLTYREYRIPIYGDTITFSGQGNGLLTREDSKECVAYLGEEKSRIVARIGYDLFGEIRSLLTAGQPPANAKLPALELHIAFLRDLITGCGVPLVEIPPVPDGHQFVACLTHDVDHPSIRQHKWDHTMFGFLYRAVFGSLRKLLRGQLSVQELLVNWVAALKLPFVHLGLARDSWRDFDDRYLELEKGLPSTFFVIPFRNQPGRNSHGPAPMIRAARYRAQDIADTIRKLIGAGCEVGLHGIDAWLNSSSGREELEEIRHLTGVSEIGVRMHWLYYDQQSPAALEKAGAAYDSTIGYNETVGYRAGTTQVFKPFVASQLLELPLHAMDTALFYPSHLALSPPQARALLGQMVENAVHFGGTLSINWHDRSLAPERLWGGCYRDLIQELKSQGAWFSTANQAIAWFRKRRSAGFETDSIGRGIVRAKLAVDCGNDLPGLRLRIHKARNLGSIGTHCSEDYVDMTVDESFETSVPSEARR